MTVDDIAIGVAEFPDLACRADPEWALKTYNQPYLGEVERVRLVVEAKDDSGQVIAGASGYQFLGWLNVELLWKTRDLAGQGNRQPRGYGIEQTGKERGASRVMLDTFQFQAPEFYKRLGYVEYGRIKDFVPGHDRYYLEKPLG